MKKGKVKRVTANGTWEGKFGVMYKFEVEFENGDVGEYSSKSLEQTKFKEGEEVEYEFTAGKFPKVKPFYAPPTNSGNFKRDDNVQELIVRQSSLKSAVDLCSGNNCTPAEVCATAQMFVDWVMIKNTNTKTQKDDLPF